MTYQYKPEPLSIKGIRKGRSTRALQSILGHDHLSITETYLNMSPQQVLDEFQRK